jgi:hypothetical protein
MLVFIVGPTEAPKEEKDADNRRAQGKQMQGENGRKKNERRRA